MVCVTVAYMKENQMMTAQMKHHTPGRGSNPISRENLTGPTRNAFVFERGAGIGWTELAGPMTFTQACQWASSLEKQNKTGQAIYAAQRVRLRH